MNGITIGILIIVGVILTFILYKIFKPYFIKHDTTILFTGGLGSGKTLESVKQAVVLYRKNVYLKYTLVNRWRKFIKPIKSFYNKWVDKHPTTKKGKQRRYWHIKALRKKPLLYSNIPIYYKPHMFSRERKWATILNEKHILLIEELREYSIVVIDEFPQFINQFMWDNDLVQNNANEFITFFRHYIGGYLIINAQSPDEIECHFRRKLNQAIFCWDFKKHLFGLFYTNRMCDMMLSDQISTMSGTQMEENTKLHFGLFPARNTYDTRCYSIRYENVLEKAQKQRKWQQLKSYKVLRLKEYTSPLDLETTERQKKAMKNRAENLIKKEKKDED